MAHQAAATTPRTEGAVLIGSGEGSLARRPSGVIVPSELANQPDPKVEARLGSVARDMDGRRRVVYPNDERKTIDKAIRLLTTQGIGFIVGCVGAYGPAPDPGKGRAAGTGHHLDGSVACGQPMRPEGVGTPDAGYGCQCTRIHFLRK